MATAEFESQLLSPPRRPYWGSAPQQPEDTTRAEDPKQHTCAEPRPGAPQTRGSTAARVQPLWLTKAQVDGNRQKKCLIKNRQISQLRPRICDF